MTTHTTTTTTTRRAPLTNNPNAINSPFQMTAASTKRSRSQSAQKDASFGQPPPKKQAVDINPAILRTPVRRSPTTTGAPPPFVDIAGRGRKVQPDAPFAIDSTSHAERARKASKAVVQQIPQAPGADQQTLDVRAWQKHYRKAFPAYVFFFESIPQDVLLKAQKQISTLGATCEKYFSAKVTHLITNRTLPYDNSYAATAKWNSRTTVNPALIDQRADQRKSTRGGGTDILLKAREYGMKIWATEKLDRVLNVLFGFPAERPSLTAPSRRDAPTHSKYVETQPNVDLSHLLRNERLHGPTDRDPNVAAKDLHYWKGPYIYIHDMFGINRPVIVREYPKVQRREDGTWPQFRSVSGGKCPFIEEAVHQRRDRERGIVREKVEQPKAAEKERSKVAAATAEARKDIKLIKEAKPVSKRILAELNAANGKATTARPAIEAPKRGTRLEGTVAFTATNESASQAGRRSNVEPCASGVQPSNVTSAIRSQMVSSHQDQPGHRAGTSKEIHALHRKVAGNVLMGNPAAKSANMARRSTDLLARAAENEAKARDVDGRSKLLKPVEEDVGCTNQRAERSRETPVIKKKTKAEPKPGYCENCREKFDDFEEHTLSRQHRKFATNNKNWEDLDDLLTQLRRPTKGPSRRYL
ncbi:Dfp1/Him1, central region-domain-containing protein [Tricharina praecox]|uniref:Dfp1/Him1, central region-domain-containing protein n=1 Tax=Tricharina praecox TaxID=43433 RepID=UPI00222057DD|nr:Dfp1/Him1, central region-domain-containing protein [Tricharina praecox]KAI5849829.1 Dfp1/Him1, central region-domain-containing protein [Tricharina praecox]